MNAQHSVLFFWVAGCLVPDCFWCIQGTPYSVGKASKFSVRWSNSQSLDFSQRCSKYQQLCREKVNDGSASIKSETNWRRSLFGFGCHIFSIFQPGTSSSIRDVDPEVTGLRFFLHHFVPSKWITCDESGFCHLRRVATWIYMRLAMKPWSWWVTLVDLFVMKYTFKTSCCVVLKSMVCEIPRTCNFRFWNFLRSSNFAMARWVGEHWGCDNLPMWQAATDRSKRIVLHLPHQRFDPQMRTQIQKGDGKWCDHWGQWGDLEDFAMSSICVVKKCFGCVLISQGWTRHIEIGQSWSLGEAKNVKLMVTF